MLRRKRKFPKGKLTSIVSFFCVLSLFAQNREIKKDQFYYKKTFEFSHINNDSLIFYGRKMQLSRDACYVIRGLIDEAKYKYQKNDFNREKDIMHHALKKNVETPPNDVCRNENLVNIYRRLFYIYKKENDYEKALKYLRKREEVVENLDKKDHYYQINKLNIRYSEASLKTALGLYEQAAKILIRAKESSSRINRDKLSEEYKITLTFYEANVYNTLGNIYVNTFTRKNSQFHLLDSAQMNYKRAYELIKPLPNAHTEPLYLIRQAKISLLREDYELALNQLNSYEKLEEEYPEYLHKIFYFKSITHWHIKNYQAAISFGEAYLIEHHKNPARGTFLLTIYDNLTRSYMALNNNSMALKYSSLGMEKFKELEKNKDDTLANIFELNQAEKEEMEQMNKTLISEQRRTNFFTYLFLGLALICGTVLYKIFKKKKPAEQLDIKENRESEKKTYKRELEKKVANAILEGLSRFEKTQNFLSNNFTKQDLAIYLQTNTTYLSIVLSTYKNQTFQQYIAHLRIEYITEKLQTNRKFSRYSIQAIAEEVGYQNASAFTRKFKDVMGVTPSQYIKSL